MYSALTTKLCRAAQALRTGAIETCGGWHASQLAEACDEASRLLSQSGSADEKIFVHVKELMQEVRRIAQTTDQRLQCLEARVQKNTERLETQAATIQRQVTRIERLESPDKRLLHDEFLLAMLDFHDKARQHITNLLEPGRPKQGASECEVD